MRPGFSLSWNVEWLGSFPVPGTDAESISQRLDRFIPRKSAIAVQLSISASGVKVSTTINDDERLLFCQSIRRINCVIGRTERNEVAYIAREPSGQLYRRLCHLFRTKSSRQVEEIESILENAFQASALIRPISPPTIQSKLSSSHFSTPTTAIHSQLRNSAIPTAATSSSTSNNHSGIEQCKLHITSSVLLNRLFRKSRPDIDSNNKENTTTTTTTATTTTVITPTKPNKQRRRPVSAVFSQALQRFSSASNYNKRFSSTDTPRKLERPVSICQESSSIPITIKSNNRQSINLQQPSTPQTFMQIQDDIFRPIRHTQTTLSLCYDERLTEWIYPIDEILEKQLEQVAYFCKTSNRNRIIGALLAQPEGAFVIRFSESKRKCLALSVRVPFRHNPTGVSHYLIIRNDNGFKIRGSNKYFQSIPMLVTHHSVMPEQLPCRLIFVHWGNMWKCNEMNNNYDYPPCEQTECSNEMFKHDR
ncbi:EGFR adapter protein [Dirofilaria immitis]